MQKKGAFSSPKLAGSQGQRRPTNAAQNQQRTRGIMCYKCQGRGHYAKDCPNQKQVLLTTNGGYVSDEEIPPNQLEEENNGQEEEDVEAIEPDCTEQPLTLVTMRTLLENAHIARKFLCG